MKIDSYAAAVLKFAARLADKTGPFALILIACGLVGAYLLTV